MDDCLRVTVEGGGQKGELEPREVERASKGLGTLFIHYTLKMVIITIICLCNFNVILTKYRYVFGIPSLVDCRAQMLCDLFHRAI